MTVLRAIASRVLAMAWASVRPSVSLSICQSVTLLYFVKTVQDRIFTKSALCSASRSLVFRDKILYP